VSTVPNQWVEKAKYDIDTAKAMLDTGRLVYVLFCCQQAVEKMLKAIVAKRTNEMPPRTHNLGRLADLANLNLSEESATFFRSLTVYYAQTRYPDQVERLGKGIGREKAEKIYSQTQEVLEWLSSIL